MSETHTTASLSPKLIAKLNGLANALRLRFLLEGVAWLVLMAVLLMLATFALDWLLRLERLPRAVVMVVAYGVLGWVVLHRLWHPLRVPLSRADLSMLVEGRYPQLQSRLISMVQLTASPLPTGTSRAMVREVASEAEAVAEGLNFDTVVERANLWRVVKLALCAVALVAGLAVWQTQLVTIWAQRNVLLADAYWPQRTYLEVDGDEFRVLRGDDLMVRVTVEQDSIAPSSILVRANYPSVGWTEERIKLASADSREFEILFRGVTEPFEFYVTGGDDSRDKRSPHSVMLIDPPGLSTITFTIMPPAYTGREPTILDGATGVITVPANGELFVDAVATKSLDSAELLLNEGDQTIIGELRIMSLTNDAGVDQPLRVVGRIAMGSANETRTAGLQVKLTDTLGYSSRRDGEYILRVAPDQPPNVTAKKFGLGSLITPDAMIPLRITGEDDHGLASGEIRISILQDATMAWDEPLEWEATDAPRRAITTERSTDLKGRGAKPGHTIAVVVSLSDTMPGEMGGPNTNSASPITLRVVSPEDLMKDLVDRQKTLRLEFVQAMGQHRSAETKVDTLIDEAADMSAAQREGELGQVTGLEQSVASEIGKASQALRGVLDELRHNRLGETQDHEALEDQVIKPLEALNEEMASLLAEIEHARRQDDPTELGESLEAAAVRQDQVHERMAEILKHMERLQSRQDLANQLQLIIRWSEEILEVIETEEGGTVETIWQPSDNEEDVDVEGDDESDEPEDGDDAEGEPNE
jgi:hypothetical protein